MKQQHLPPMFNPNTNSFTTNLDTYQDFAYKHEWVPLKITNDGKRIGTIYLTPAGLTLYADFDTKTERLISNVDRSMK